jgi:hypothetical protein
MKKILMSLFLMAGIFLVTSCAIGGDKILKCTFYTNDTEAKYTINSHYKVYYNEDEIVSKINTVEVVTSTEKTVLDYFQNYMNTTYSTMDSTYGGYTYSVERASNKVSADSTIDYKVLNLDKLVTDEPSIKSAINTKGELTLDGIKDIYETMGITCEE